MNFKSTIRFAVALCVAIVSMNAHAELQYTCSPYGNDSLWWGDFQKTIVNSDLDTLLFGVRIRDWKHEHLVAMQHKEEDCMAKSGGKYSEEFLHSKRMGDELRMKESLEYLKMRDRNLLASEAKVAAQAQSKAAGSPSNNAILTPQPSQTDANFVAKEEAQNKQLQADEVNRQQQEVQSQAAFQHEQNERSKTKNLQIFLAIIAAAIGGLGWIKFVRNRCPNCKSTKYDITNETETNRWLGTKQVSEKHSRGTNTRHVQTTYVTKQFHYCCKNCQHDWMKERKEELGASSAIGRFLTGY